MLRTVIATALLVALLAVQRSSSDSVPFDNPFWVEWLRGQRRSGIPSSAPNEGPNKDKLQDKLSSHTFGEYSTETVPLLQPLFPRDKTNQIGKGKVSTPKATSQLNSGYIDEHDSDGQLTTIQRSHRKVPPINGKSASSNSISVRANTFITSAADAQSAIYKNKINEKNVNDEKTYIEESRSSSNLLPINVLNSNEFVWSNNPSLSTLSNDEFDGKIFDNEGGDIIDEDDVNSNIMTSTLKPATTVMDEKHTIHKVVKPNEPNFFEAGQRNNDPYLQSPLDSPNKVVDKSVFPHTGSVISTKNDPSVWPLTTTGSSFPPTTTTTASTTTRTLVASWPAIRSRNLGSSRAENRFRKRVPISSSRKSTRRNKVKHRRRPNLKRRRQTITPQFRTTTSSAIVVSTISTVPTITQNIDTTKTRVSRTPNPTTTTSTTTTTTVKVTSSTTVTTTTSSIQTSTAQASTSTTTPPTIAPTTSAATFVFTNLRTASALVVTRNVTSTRVVTAPIPDVVVSEEEATVATTTEMASTDREVLSTTPDTIIEKETTIPKDKVLYNTIELETESIPSELTSEYESLDYTQIPETVDYEHQGEEENFIPMPSNINHVKAEDPGVRSPRLTDWEPSQPSEEGESILSGGYHETNPGQYHEINPGQYHESNPGQYHEINPGQPVDLGEGQETQAGQYHESDPGQPVALAQVDGQEIIAGEYHEVNPGQYHEVNPGQYHEVNPGQYTDDTSKTSDRNGDHTVELVDVEHTDNAKIYNVQQRVNEFIIGEYGTITNSGQTLQGVRYTAVADDQSGVDPNFIYETLVKYFPMAAAKFAKSNSRTASQ